MNVYLKVFKWVKGVLKTADHEFEKIEHAFEHLLGRNDHDHAKIYDHMGRCIHEHHPDHGHDSYDNPKHDEKPEKPKKPKKFR